MNHMQRIREALSSGPMNTRQISKNVPLPINQLRQKLALMRSLNQAQIVGNEKMPSGQACNVWALVDREVKTHKARL